ncbi:unnamed protein product [marine sediment metagenome]|uniref:Uncharacterized protein n=1 Tax=marine sediment metagenome TaxID=412755 RepID=X0SY80_9ZZZZ
MEANTLLKDELTRNKDFYIARVTQIESLLKLSPKVLDLILSLVYSLSFYYN